MSSAMLFEDVVNRGDAGLAKESSDGGCLPCGYAPTHSNIQSNLELLEEFL
jgi:hypothetical protein